MHIYIHIFCLFAYHSDNLNLIFSPVSVLILLLIQDKYTCLDRGLNLISLSVYKGTTFYHPRQARGQSYFLLLYINLIFNSVHT